MWVHCSQLTQSRRRRLWSIWRLELRLGVEARQFSWQARATRGFRSWTSMSAAARHERNLVKNGVQYFESKHHRRVVKALSANRRVQLESKAWARKATKLMRCHVQHMKIRLWQAHVLYASRLHTKYVQLRAMHLRRWCKPAHRLWHEWSRSVQEVQQTQHRLGRLRCMLRLWERQSNFAARIMAVHERLRRRLLCYAILIWKVCAMSPGPGGGV